MLFIAVGNAVVFVGDLFVSYSGVTLSEWLYMDWNLVLQGEVWRMLTFVLIPPSSIFWLLTPLVIYMYYWMGKSIQSEWGRLKLTIYYLTGMLIVLAGSAVFGRMATGADLNLSLFMAMATLFPETEIRIYFVLPVKMKWLALLNAALIIGSVLLTHSFLPLMPLINYLLYFGPGLIKKARRQSGYSQKTMAFKTEVRRAKKERGYLHKCAVCGVTDTDDPGTEFRYCSLCSGYECYCHQHIKNHEHH